MRMWMIDPTLLCTKHLNGEHGEIHKHLPSLRRGVSVAGRFEPVAQIQLNAIQSRHDELAAEIDRRAALRGRGGHKSPLVDVPDLQAIYPEYYDIEVESESAIWDLFYRCQDCAQRIAARQDLRFLVE